MLRRNYLFLVMMVIGIGMIIWFFFGGNGESDKVDMPQATSTGFIEMINGTGNNFEMATSQVDLGEISGEENGYIKINVMMPKYFYNSGWKKFAQDLYDSSSIYMNYILVDDLNSYRDQLYDITFSDADFFLYPYDWNEKISTRSFSSDKSMQLYFDELLDSITQTDKVSFIPFAVDPMVTYVYSGLSVYNFYDISELVLNRESTFPLSFPLFFGMNTEDLEGNGFVWEYQDIMRYALLHYFQKNNDYVNLQMRIDSNVLENYNMVDLRTISNAISAPECKYFPSLCFQLYNFVGVRFGFLSDRDVVNKYFTGKKAKFDMLSVNPVPFFQLESPVRVRGWGIRGSLDDIKKIEAIYKLIKQYKDKHNQYNLRNSTLSAFKSDENENQLLYNQYVGLRGYVLQGGGDYMNSLRNMSKFKELMGHEITAKEYLR